MARRTATLLGAGPDAEDVVQDALVKAYRALGGFRDGSAFRPWLLKIVANEALNQVRSARRRAEREKTSALLSGELLARASEREDPAAAALASERKSALLAALRTLPERDRTVVTCRYLLDLDEAETATVLGWPRGTVKSRLHRALRKLRRELDATTVPAAHPKEVGHAKR